MSIRPEKLQQSLAKGLDPVYLIAGAEHLLVQESRDLVIHAAQQQGFQERNIFTVDAKFNWDELGMASVEQSLFASRKIIDLRIPSGKPGVAGGKFLSEFAENPDPDVLLIVSCGAWDTASRKSKWASQLASAGILVEIWPIKPHELPAWISKRMQVAGLKAEPEAVRLLAEFVEGNLMAAQQEIEKISLLDGNSLVTVDTIRSAVGNNARFDTFRLGECMMQGKAAECLRVADGLQRMGVAIQAVCGALNYQLSQLEGVRSAIARGDSEKQAFGQYRVFGMYQPMMKQALRRIPAQTLGRAFGQLSRIDRQSKGQEIGDPWQTLEKMLTLLSTAGLGSGRLPPGIRAS